MTAPVSISDAEKLRRTFRANYDKRRKRSRYAFCAILALGVFGAIMLYSFPSYIAASVFIVLMFVIGSTVPNLLCPKCGKNPESGIDWFCPACGAAIERMPSVWTMDFKCDACGTRLYGSGKGGRVIKIRFCTHCGTHLDAEGI